MYNDFEKVMMFLSEYSHVMLTIGIKEWEYGNHILSLFLFLLALVSVFIAFNADKVIKSKLKVTGGRTVRVYSSIVKNNSMQKVFGGLSALFFVTLFLNFHFWWSWAIIGVVLIGLFVYQIQKESRIIPYNPFLYFKGYRIYNADVVKNQDVLKTLLLTKRKRSDAVMMQSQHNTINSVGDVLDTEGYIIEE